MTEGLTSTIEFQMSLLTTVLTPIVLRNWLYKKGIADIFKRTRVTAK